MRSNSLETCNDFADRLVQTNLRFRSKCCIALAYLDRNSNRDLQSMYSAKVQHLHAIRTSPFGVFGPSASWTAMTEKDSQYRTVLIVEDSEDARYFMRLELEQLGYRVVEAENGERAVEVAEREHPDIILMDLSLPIMDGIAATEKIRSRDGFKTVPVIAVTAHQETDFRADAKAAGFDAYVTKPIDMPWLSELIEGLLV